MVRASCRTARRFQFSGTRRSVNRSAVGHHGVRAQVHGRARDVRPPAEVDVLAEVRDALGEPADRGEQVGAHEHAGPGHCEDLSGGVVLGLVELAGLRQRRAEAVDVDRVADRPEPLRVVPVDDLRADDAAGRPEGLGDERGDRVGLERHVVVHQQVERRPLDRGEHLVRGRREPLVGVEPLHEGRREHIRDAFGGVGPSAVVDDEDREVLVVLIGQGLERAFEPVARVLGDEHRHDRRGAVPHDGFLGPEAPLLVEIVFVDVALRRSSGRRRGAVAEIGATSTVRRHGLLGSRRGRGRFGLVRVGRDGRVPPYAGTSSVPRPMAPTVHRHEASPAANAPLHSGP